MSFVGIIDRLNRLEAKIDLLINVCTEQIMKEEIDEDQLSEFQNKLLQFVADRKYEDEYLLFVKAVLKGKVIE